MRETNLLPKQKKQENPLLLKRIVLIALLTTTFIFVSGHGGGVKNKGMVESATTDASFQSSTQEYNLNTQLINSKPVLKKDVPKISELTTHSYLVYDTGSEKIIASSDAQNPAPVASLTKLTTALAVSRNLNPTDIVTVPADVTEDIPNPKMGLVTGEKITVSSLVEAMLVGSCNDAAELLAYALGDGDKEQAIQLMNQLAEDLGLKRTRYANTTGFDDPNAYSTATDVLTVALEVNRSPWLTAVLSESSGTVSSVDGKFVHYFSTTSNLLEDKNDIIIGGKTGYTDEAKGNLAVFAKSPSDSEIIAVLLGSEDREGEMKKLLDWVFFAYNW